MRPLPERLAGMPGLPRLEGEEEATADGVTYRRGDTVRIAVDAQGDPYDGMLAGRTATVERILWDVEGKLYLGVTVDDDPGQELMRDTGRHHFFFVGELEKA